MKKERPSLRPASTPLSARRLAGTFPSELGRIWAVVDGAGALTRLDFEGGRSAPRSRRQLEDWCAARGQDLTWSDEALAHVRAAVAAYFDRSSRDLDLAVAPEGTPFQLRVWRELQEIPYGATWTYGELAQRIGRPTASRAVGRANATNPVSLVIPCHRVIGTGGALTGYGGGIERKRALLAHERGLSHAAPQTQLHFAGPAAAPPGA